MELSKVNPLYLFDSQMSVDKQCLIVGTDEAGRGPLAGPVIAAAVQLDTSSPIEGINDSKKLTEKKREKLYSLITQKSVLWSIGIATHAEIDTINILQASLLAMKRALQNFNLLSQKLFVLIDGNKTIPSISSEKQEAIIKGDTKSASIAAASIIAKVTRDRIMRDYHTSYPLYQFNRHKGYPTSLHRSVIHKIGLCPIHRRTFCKKFLKQTNVAI